MLLLLRAHSTISTCYDSAAATNNVPFQSSGVRWYSHSIELPLVHTLSQVGHTFLILLPNLLDLSEDSVYDTAVATVRLSQDDR